MIVVHKKSILYKNKNIFKKMNENDNDINNINKNLQKKCELLENVNNELKKRIKKNEDNIINLTIQINFLREEYQKEINELKEIYNQKIDNLFKIISQNNNKAEEKNEIIMHKEKNDDYIDINNIYKDIEKMVNIKLEEYGNVIYDLLGINDKIDKKEKNKKTELNIDNKTKELFENILLKIFNDKNEAIAYKDLSDLKKLTAVLKIKGLDPIEFGESAFKKYLNNDLNKINKNNNLNIITLKKINIFPIIEKVSII